MFMLPAPHFALTFFPPGYTPAVPMGSWSIEQTLQASQKWHVGTWSPTTLSVVCNTGDSLIIYTNQWNSDAGAAFIPSISPGSLIKIYDPEATYLGTAEPVFAQAFAVFNLAAGTYTITPPNLGGPGGDGDIYVLRVAGLQGIRTYGAAEIGGGATNTGSYTSISATLQAADVAGDLIVAIGGTDNNTVTTTLTVATPTGFTNLAKQTDGTNSPPSSFDYKTGVGSAETVTYTWPNYASPVGEAILAAFMPIATRSVLAYASKADPNQTSTTSPLITSGITTPVYGSTIIVELLTQSTSTAPVSNFSDSYGNTWTLVATNYYAGGTSANGEFPCYLLKCVNAKGGINHTFQLTKNSVQDECTIYAVVLNGGDIGNYTVNTTGTYSGSVTTSQANSIVLSFWSPNDTGAAGYTDNYHAPAGWTQMANNNNAYNSMSGADAYISVPVAGTVVTATWTADNTGNGINANQCMYMVEVT